MALIPMLVGTVVGLYLTLVTIYFLVIIRMSERLDRHRPMALQPRPTDVPEAPTPP